MIYKYNEKIDVKELCDLRQSVGWNRMEKEMADNRLKSYYHIAVYEEDLKDFYARFGFYNLLGGQLETYKSE